MIFCCLQSHLCQSFCLGSQLSIAARLEKGRTPSLRTPAIGCPVNWGWATLSNDRRVVAVEVVAQEFHAAETGLLDQSEVIGDVFEVDRSIWNPVSANGVLAYTIHWDVICNH